MRRRLPPMEQIEAFIEAARGPSFREAAERCALSTSAFSRRVQAFSAFFDVGLFERAPGGMRLTQAGKDILAELEPAFLELKRAALTLARSDIDEGSVTLTLSHSLAVGWLIPRLDAFRAHCPGIELALKTRRDATDLRRGDADIGLCFSDVDLSGLSAEPILEVTAAPVASPEVAAAFDVAGDALAPHRLLSVTSPPGIWRWWEECVGRTEALTPSASFDILQAMYESAALGFGIAIGASPTVWPYLESGRLVRLALPSARLPGGGYHVAAVPDRKRRRAVTAVWRWLEVEARRTPEFPDAAGAAHAP